MNDNMTPNLKRQLRSSDASQRTVALVLVGKSRVHSLVDQITDMLENDEDDEVRAMAAWTLDILGNPDTIPALVSALYDSSFSVRSNAGWAIVHLGRRILPNLVVPDVIDVLKDKTNHDARQMAYLILTRIGGQVATDAIKTYWD